MNLYFGDSGDLYPGIRVLWRHTPKGGYGFVMRIPVTVVSKTAKRCVVRIDATEQEISVPYRSLILPKTMVGAVPHIELPVQR